MALSIPLTEQKSEILLKKDKFSQYNKMKRAYIPALGGVRSPSMSPQEGGFVASRDSREMGRSASTWRTRRGVQSGSMVEVRPSALRPSR